MGMFLIVLLSMIGGAILVNSVLVLTDRTYDKGFDDGVESAWSSLEGIYIEDLLPEYDDDQISTMNYYRNN